MAFVCVCVRQEAKTELRLSVNFSVVALHMHNVKGESVSLSQQGEGAKKTVLFLKALKNRFPPPPQKFCHYLLYSFCGWGQGWVWRSSVWRGIAVLTLASRSPTIGVISVLYQPGESAGSGGDYSDCLRRGHDQPLPSPPLRSPVINQPFTQSSPPHQRCSPPRFCVLVSPFHLLLHRSRGEEPHTMEKLTRAGIIPHDYSVQQLAVNCVTLHNYDTSQYWLVEVAAARGGNIVGLLFCADGGASQV